MRFTQRLTGALGLAALATTAACSGTGSNSPALIKPEPASHVAGATSFFDAASIARSGIGHRATGASWLDRRTFSSMITTPGPHYIVYAADFTDSKVDLYQYNTAMPSHAKQLPFGQVSVNSPVGLAIDTSSNLYVVDFNDGVINEYTPGSMPQVALALQAPPNPQGVAVGPDGTVYVTSDGTRDAQNNVVNGGISVYKKGATTPYMTLADPAIQIAYYATVDKANNVYVSYGSADHSSFSIGEFKAGTTTLVPFGLTKGAYQVKLDGNGNLLTQNVATGTYDEYANGSASPTYSFSASPAGTPAFFDLSYARDDVFSYVAGASGINEFSYPTGVAGAPINPSSPGYNYGIVVAPAAPYPPSYTP